MPNIDKAKAKHNKLVAGLARLQAKRVKLLATQTRNEKRIDKQIRAIARSSKRLNRLAIVTHNAGPTASAVPVLIDAVAAKPTEHHLNDAVPSFGKTEPAPGEHQPGTGPTPTASTDAERQSKPKRKPRRTPDDFRAEMEARRKL